ncbi:hypothetical protein MK805_07320 [Shimazuella sp. AN120528]|uniref:hypothetical protein n=1 Tax=Shimazuella soli TaxID=1892854 RepID=UPI001F1090FB|nr:hypothetical protein [Shimazuella soli]MCH5584781.1 hypothetical protein [Shimazuella soli]
MDTDKNLPKAQQQGKVAVTPEVADRAWQKTKRQYKKILAPKRVIIFPDAGDNVKERTKVYERALKRNAYLFLRHHRATFDTAVISNAGRLRKVDPWVMWRVFEVMEEAWKVLQQFAHGYEVIDVERASFQEVAQNTSLQDLLLYLGENIEVLQERANQAMRDEDAQAARLVWKAAKDLHAWRAPIVKTYRTRKGLEVVERSLATLGDVVQTSWATWRSLESKQNSSVLVAMDQFQAAWSATDKVTQALEQLRIAIPQALEFADRASILQVPKSSLLQEVIRFKRIIRAALDVAEEAELARREAWHLFEESKRADTGREIPVDLDLYEAGLKAGKASKYWADLECSELLESWKAALKQQQRVLEKWNQTQVWNDDQWNRATQNLYVVLTELKNKVC